ncbi:MAG: hypothetical protein L3K09_00360 [Thermoplasmata archaeon]|nr:hypothetical protein [Thermoplasmata archaeon]
MTTRPRIQAELDGALGAWDLHILRCTECLSYGTHFCPEGEYASERVAAVQAALLRFDEKASRADAGRIVRATAGRRGFRLPLPG